MALARYMKQKFGTQTRGRTNPITDTVLTTVTEILQNNPDRLSFLVINLGANDIYVAWDREVSATHGVFIGNSGGNVSMTADEDGEIVGYALYAIALVGNSEVYIVSTEGE